MGAEELIPVLILAIPILVFIFRLVTKGWSGTFDPPNHNCIDQENLPEKPPEKIPFFSEEADWCFKTLFVIALISGVLSYFVLWIRADRIYQIYLWFLEEVFL